MKHSSITIVATLIAPVVHAAPSDPDQGDVVRQSAVIDAPVEQVWNAWTTTEGLRSWLAPNVDIDLRIGGTMRSSYEPSATLGDETTIEQTILSYVPMHMLSMRCTKSPKSFPWPESIARTWSVIEFEPLGPDRTRVVVLGLGYGADDESQEMRAFFERNNPIVLKTLQSRFSDEEPAQEDDRTLDLLNTMVDEWTHASVSEDGTTFRVRNEIRSGPDDRSLVTSGWLGDEKAMFPHSSTLILRIPQSQGGGIGFHGVDQDGTYSQGQIRSGRDHRQLIWHWYATSLDGASTYYHIAMTFEDENRYRMLMRQQQADGSFVEWPEMTFHRSSANTDSNEEDSSSDK